MANQNVTAEVGTQTSSFTKDDAAKQLNNLHTRYQTLLGRYRKGLYAVVADAWTLQLQIISNEANASAFVELCKSKEIPVKKSAPLGAVMRWVFGNDRRKASQYAAVVNAASLAKQSPETLADWISEKGGVDAIIRGDKGKKEDVTVAPKAQSLEKLRDVAVNTLNQRSMPFKTFKAPTKCEIGQYVLGFFRVAKAGTLELVEVQQNQDVVKVAMAAYGRTIAEIALSSKSETGSSDAALEAALNSAEAVDAEKSAA